MYQGSPFGMCLPEREESSDYSWIISLIERLVTQNSVQLKYFVFLSKLLPKLISIFLVISTFVFYPGGQGILGAGVGHTGAATALLRTEPLAPEQDSKLKWPRSQPWRVQGSWGDAGQQTGSDKCCDDFLKFSYLLTYPKMFRDKFQAKEKRDEASTIK
jgi:hypothetical protein